MDLFTIAGLLVFLLCFSLSVFTFFIGTKKLYLLVGLFNLAVAVWGIGCFLVGFRLQEDLQLWGWRVAHAGGYFIPVVFYHIVSSFCKNKRSLLILIGYVQASIYCLISLFTNLVFVGSTQAYGITYFSADSLYGTAFGFYVGFVLISFIELCRFYLLKSTELEKKQTLYILVGFGFGFAGGTSILLPAFGVKLLYPFGNLGICIYALVLTTALIRFRLFDIDEVVNALHEARLMRLGLLMASINHEVKNPLYVTQGILETEINKNPDTPSRSILEKAKLQISRALEVIRSINNFISVDKASKSAAAAPLRSAIDAVLDLLTHELDARNIRRQNEVESEVIIAVERRYLEEILLNLFLNSIQAMPNGGTISVKSVSDSQHLIIEISDSGKGIASKDRKNILRPFYSLKKDGGMGLGLYISKQIVESYDGKISIASKPGEGTTVTLRFPAVNKTDGG